MSKRSSNQNRYQALIEKIFFDRYVETATELSFKRTGLEEAATELSIILPKNLGDVVYPVRRRTSELV